MLKSTAMPTNSTAKAIEIRFKVPTVAAAKPPVTSSPTTRVIRIAAIRRSERRAMNRIRQTSARVATIASWAPAADRRELLVVERDVAGLADPHAVLRRQAELARGGPHGILGGRAGDSAL